MKKILKKIAKGLWRLCDFGLRMRNVSSESRTALQIAVKQVCKEFYRGKNANFPAVFDEKLLDGKNVLGRQIIVTGKKRILIDVTQILLANARSGIQRVVVKMLDAMLADTRYNYVPVGLYHGQMRFVKYCQDDCSFHPDLSADFKAETGDTLLMLDSSWTYYDHFENMFQLVHAVGGKIYCVVYDLIPILQCQFTAEGMPQVFNAWFTRAIDRADGLLCISQTVATQVKDYLKANPQLAHTEKLKIGHFVLGADFVDVDCSDVDTHIAEICNVCKDRKKFISVSTVEPRKNYGFMLDVMEKLWDRGYDTAYWIVGKQGWKVDELMERIKTHPELNRRLFYFSFLSDEALQKLYSDADILLNLSHGEGYGLSLVEGAHYQCSIVASDIPVFKEVITDNTTLFCNINSLDKTVDAIAEKLDKKSFVPSQAKYYKWSDALDTMLDVIEKDNWDYGVDHE